MVALKTFSLRRRQALKAWENFPEPLPGRCHSLHLTSLPLLLIPEAAQLQGELSAAHFFQGLAYKLQAKCVPQNILLKQEKPISFHNSSVTKTNHQNIDEKLSPGILWKFPLYVWPVLLLVASGLSKAH